MSVLKKVQKLVGELEEKRIKLEAASKAQVTEIKNLTGGLGKTRAEVSVLQKAVNQAMADNVMLKNQLKILESQTDGGVGGGRKVEIVKKLGGNGRSPLAVFSEEIWSKIFDGLKEDPEDLKNCAKVCVKFQQMLEPQRTLFLFEDVVKIIHGPKVQGYENLESQKTPSGIPLAKCRRVCKAYKKSSDTLYRQECPIFPHNLKVDRYSNGNALVFWHMGRVGGTKNPWNNLELRNLSPHQNPIPSHYLVYRGGWPFNVTLEKQKEFQNSFVAFLQKFGHHVWYLKMETGFGKPQPAWFQFVCSLMQFLPNLQALGLHMDGFGNENVKQSNAVFPTIPSMTSLSLEKCAKSIQNAIVSANPQLERCKLDVVECSSLSNLKNLWELSLRGSPSILEQLSGNLTKLTVDTIYKGDWSRLFGVLEKNLADTLVDLHMKLQGPCDNAGSLRLNLPKLEVLELQISRCFNPIDFILPLMQLKCLKVDLEEMFQNRNDRDKPDDDEYLPLGRIKETVKFHQFTHDLKNSNVWQLLPNLKKVMARTDREHGYYEDRWDDKKTPEVDSDWQYCTRGEVGN